MGDDIFSKSIPLDLPKIKSVIYYLIQDDTIVYIGSTSNTLARVFTHLKDKDFNKVTYYPVEEKDKFDTEASEIVKYKPKYNRSVPANNLFCSQSKIRERHKGSTKVEVAMALCKPKCIMRDIVYYDLNEVEKELERLRKEGSR